MPFGLHRLSVQVDDGDADLPEQLAGLAATLPGILEPEGERGERG